MMVWKPVLYATLAASGVGVSVASAVAKFVPDGARHAYSKFSFVLALLVCSGFLAMGISSSLLVAGAPWGWALSAFVVVPTVFIVTASLVSLPKADEHGGANT